MQQLHASVPLIKGLKLWSCDWHDQSLIFLGLSSKNDSLRKDQTEIGDTLS